MCSKRIFSKLDNLTSKVLFLDRDGVINKKPETHHYVTNHKDFVFNVGIFELIAEAKINGFKIIIVTNQRGISRGIYTFDDFCKLTDQMQAKLVNGNVGVDAIYFCPHSLEAKCECRKPMPGMFLEAKKDFTIDFSKSIMIGDSDDDILAARNAGVLTTYKIESDILSGLTDIFHE